jgi:Mg2+ and Co2+ transporter CorA
MEVFQFTAGHAPEPASEGIAGESTGFYWLDIERTETDWYREAQQWLPAPLHERHIRDTLNETHPPFYDGTDDYDLLVVRAMCSGCPPESPDTHPIALIISGNAVVSIRPPGDPVFVKLRERFQDARARSPASPGVLVYLLLDQVTNTLLSGRDATSELLSQWQVQLLERNELFKDWQALTKLHGQLRRLEVVTESQMDAISQWREQTSLVLEPSLAVRLNDLEEHLRRVYHHATVVQHDIDTLVQMYFSANAQRTSEILQFLAIISAVFLPLNLLAGVFGMNFAHLPLLQLPYGHWIVAGVMLVIVTGLLLWFLRRRWI